jgi:hypothetical protein
MSINRVETIKNLIVNKVSGLSHIRNVYNYQNSNPEGFPFAVVVLDTFSGDFADFSAISKRNLRTWDFLVKVYVERDEASFGSQKAERIAVETTDELLKAFDSDLTLGGEVKYVKVVNGIFGNESIGNTVRVCEFTISCVDLVSIN